MENSWSDSDLVKQSISESRILAPDSDGEESNQAQLHRMSTEIVLSSDEDISQSSTNKLNKKNSRGTSIRSNLSDQNVLKSDSKKNKSKIIGSGRDSDGNIKSQIIKEHSSVISNDISQNNDRSSCESLKLYSRKKKNNLIESDEDEEDGITSWVFGNHSHSNKQSTAEPSPFPENLFSSTTLFGDDNKSISSTNISEISHTKSDSRSSLNITTSAKVPNINITEVDKRTSNKNEFRNIIHDQSDDDDDDRSSGRVITIDSESEDDGSKKSEALKIHDVEINNQLSSLTLSSSNKVPKSELQSNDYFSRIESLKAEETRLNVQVSEVLKKIDTIKTTMRTANLSALPDKGVRLKISLKKEETKLNDLRYQQSSLSNEILKCQLSSKVKQPVITARQESVQKVYKLPTTSTDINAMGKKALETHRTQQALTVDALRTLHNSLKNCPNEDTCVPDPTGLVVSLMPHQKHALAWMMWREKEKPSGGILADDMGLGKTLSMISLVLKSYEYKDEDNDDNESSEEQSDTENDWLSSKRDKLIPGKTLVVCPASLTSQWENEIKKRVKSGLLDVMIHHGSNREKIARRLARPDIVITTYSILPRESSSQGPLYGIWWERIILDEGHQIRNYKTQTAQSVFKLKAKHRWVLTGTPVHNKEIDLYALLKFLRCSPFDDLAVWKRWVDNRDAAGIQRLNTITKSLMLRRTKESLQEQGKLKSLKEKAFHTIFVKLDSEEQSAYEKLLEFSSTLFSQFLYQKAEKKDALPGMSASAKSSNYLKNLENPFENHPDLARLHKQMKEVTDVKSHHILVLLLRLRQFCCHPPLITTMFETEDMKNVGIEDADGLDIDLMDKLTRMSLAPSSREDETETVDKEVEVGLSTQNPLFAKGRLGSKMKKVLSTLEDILKLDGDKAVVVSQWVSLLEVIHTVLKEKKIRCVTLNGSVPVKDRGELVEKFNRKGHGPRIILLSLTAGGVGLNLVGGNHLLLLDLHWNPQLESQACDRIYRVGQEKEVKIYKFVVAETIEERILNLQKSKLNMANDILTGAKHTTKLSLDDLKMLFQIHN